MPQSSVIISVYRDVAALSLIIAALERQSHRDFEIIISEDGESRGMADFTAHLRTPLAWQHLTQPDQGFRKNRALNRAIHAAKSDWLIFIDGDCVPHDDFVAAHARHAAAGVVTAGRRIELGARWSAWLRADPHHLAQINRRSWWWWHLPALLRDRTKASELMLLPFVPDTSKRPINLVGCNFAAHRRDLEAINGFDEAYQAAGIGEDSDIDWRLAAHGARRINLKFAALQWHLDHPRSYAPSPANAQRLAANRQAAQLRPRLGLSKPTTD
jgi:GT2 family glycosyltransferase